MRKEVGRLLVEEGVISEDKLQLALLRQKRTKRRLGDILVDLQLVTETEIARVLAKQLPGWEYYDGPITVASEVLKKLTLETARKQKVLPVYLDGKKENIVFLFADPYDTRATDLLNARGFAGYLDKCFITTPTTINLFLDRIEKEQRSIEIVEQKAREITEEGFAHGEVAKEFVDVLINETLAKGATDIHIEPTPETSDIRYRIDGILHPVVSLLKQHHINLVNVLYSRAEIDPGDFKKYHDERIQWVPGKGRPVDIRLSSIPTKHGASVCLRIFDSEKKSWPLNALGYTKEQVELIQEVIRRPHGMILMTGPTGSGKTTTLYTVLSILKSVRLKIVTIEDPIEMEMPLVQQEQVDEATGITFGKALRSILRHDPDVVLIGEIRDHETAQEAMRAAFTGHLVFSTLHTNTAVGSILRLVDLGISPEYIASAVICLISQRLVRKLCPECKQKVGIANLPEKYKKLTDSDYFKNKKFVYEASKCEYCIEGYHGRTAVAEILLLTKDLHPFILKPDPAKLLEAAQREHNFKTIQQDGLRLVASGTTDFEEIRRVVGFEF